MKLPRVFYGFEGDQISGSMSIEIRGGEGMFAGRTGRDRLDEVMTLFCKYSGISIDLANATIADDSESAPGGALLDIFWGIGAVVGKLLKLTQHYHGSANDDAGGVQVFIHPVMTQGARSMAFEDHSRDKPYCNQQRARELGSAVARVMDGFTWGAKCGIEYRIERAGNEGIPESPVVVSLAKAISAWIKTTR